MAQREGAMSPEEMRGSSSSDKTYFDYDQPPLYRLEDIFVDLTQNALSNDLGKALRILKDRPLRVATVCSGTESPLLAMNMVKKGEYQVTLQNIMHIVLTTLAAALEKLQTGLDLEFEHVFSCEIVAYRQAYIERTCRPPLLFRDIKELKEPKAYTAYGVHADVPDSVDLLIAGTSCVDFSNLNNNKKELAETGKGESSKTFFGLLNYVRKHKPAILILENVKAKPKVWEAMADHYNTHGYATEIIDVDTKNFYLPQTRQRRYMVCIRKENGPKGSVEQKLTQVKTLVNSLKRQASCPGGFFLLDENSKQMNQIVNDRDIVTKKNSSTEWTKAQNLHRNQRQEFDLGQQKPISNPGSKMDARKGPDFYMHTWFNSRGEREKDLLDIIFLKAMTPTGRGKSTFDMSFKERWMNISQAVDRQRKGTKGFGNVACVTPKGIHFCSTRGGPLTGQEALAMQGLPLSQMIFTRETQDELQQLAGNAMTSTVVCAVTLATLIHGHQFLKERETDDPENKEKTNALDFEAELKKAKFDEKEMFCSEVAKPSEVLDPEEQVSNLCNDMGRMQKWARGSSRYCYCEKQSETRSEIFMCNLCGHTSCNSCNRDPPHGPTAMASIQRLEPLEFIKSLRKDLPMRLRLPGLDGSMFDQFLDPTLSENGGIDINDGASEGEESNGEEKTKKCKRGNGTAKKSYAKKAIVRQTVAKKTTGNETTSTRSSNIIPKPDDREKYRSVIGAAVADTVNFVNIKRAESWAVFYEGPNSTLQLVIGRKSIQWLFFAKPPADYPARCLLREIFAKPIAKMTPRMTPDRTILQGRWKISQPISTQSSVTISGIDNTLSSRLPVYPVRCGISENSITRQKVYERISVKSNGNEYLEDLCGTYELLPNCGTAFGALYKRVETEASIDGYEDTPIFLFFDPQKCSDVKHDSFVFAFEHDRISGYAPRITIAELSHEWRPESVTATDKPVNLFYRAWLTKPEVMLMEFIDSEVSCQPLIPRPTVTFDGGDNGHSFSRLLIASGPMAVFNLPPQDSTLWKHHNIERSPEILKEAAWAFERSSLQMGLEGWRDVTVDGDIQHQQGTICEICHPKMPEPGNDQEAIAYERLMKTKWPKWIIRTRELENDNLELQFALNIRAMAHTACQNMLPLLKGKAPQISWRLESNYFDVGRKYHGKFRLKNTEEVSPRRGLPAFLREEQQRSLDWMIDQERPNIEPFVEMEVDEAPLSALAWRAEVRVTVETVIRGGLCADEVGFGKTALMLGLISSQWENGWNDRIPNTESGLKQTNATIIIAPSNIIGQWSEETEKFLTKDYRKKNFVVDIKTAADFKNPKGKKKRKSQIAGARIVLVSLSALDHSECVEFLKKYSWARLVVDEYHLLWDNGKGSRSEAILCLNAYTKWILSGTPGLEDFADVKTIARLLGAHLGIDDDGDIASANKRLAYTREKYSHLQKLERFQPVHSEAWYKNRRNHAQEFLNRFARQNYVEERIPFDAFYGGFQQSADERHVYLILERFLREQGNGDISDRSNRVPPPAYKIALRNS
ncbi:C-5 cytosine methyltransferase [Penicillium waksmanii]|uniref:C-5 cytosine methyltransferase n=1 Tax=Penicillium waksmanii TaxID=69791 RepID=UPI0025468CCB|nr:C-5 cytosine methyltransferase [Penicillium waksmanii]KAJ5988617.1 C-5 cytosine methyltransferase [Penicillium waksmanii]